MTDIETWEACMIACLAELRRLKTPLKPVWKRSLKKGYGYCVCASATGAPYIVQSSMKFCPNCGVPLKWEKSKI